MPGWAATVDTKPSAPVKKIPDRNKMKMSARLLVRTFISLSRVLPMLITPHVRYAP